MIALLSLKCLTCLIPKGSDCDRRCEHLRDSISCHRSFETWNPASKSQCHVKVLKYDEIYQRIFIFGSHKANEAVFKISYVPLSCELICQSFYDNISKHNVSLGQFYLFLLVRICLLSICFSTLRTGFFGSLKSVQFDLRLKTEAETEVLRLEAHAVLVQLVSSLALLNPFEGLRFRVPWPRELVTGKSISNRGWDSHCEK